MFLAAVSGGLVAPGLVATASSVGTAFYAFGNVLLPTLAFVGLVTFELVPQEFIEAGSELVVPVIASGRSRAGAEVEMPLVHVFTFKDAKIVVLRVFFTEAEALEAVGLRE